VNIFHPFL